MREEGCRGVGGGGEDRDTLKDAAKKDGGGGIRGGDGEGETRTGADERGASRTREGKETKQEANKERKRKRGHSVQDK